MVKTKILYIAHEMAPFLELTNISKITRELPQAMQEKGYEIRVLMPRFGNINERRNRLHEVIRLSGMNIQIDDNDNPLIIKVASIQGAKMQVYFLDNEEYFKRKFVFNDSNEKFYGDNDERAIFFCKGALETVKKLGWAPDIVHCHGWMTSLVPAYIKTSYKNDPTFKNSKVIYSVYENCFKDKLSPAFHKKAIMSGMKAEDITMFGERECSDMHIGAIAYSDAVVKASENITGSVLEAIKGCNKPVINHQEQDYADVYANFYDEVTIDSMVALEAL